MAQHYLWFPLAVLRIQSVHATGMSDIPFHATRYGKTFFGDQLPELIRQLARLNQNLERLTQALRTDPDSKENDDDNDE